MPTMRPTGLDVRTFKHVMGHFAAGVAVVTAHAAGEDHGLTATAVTSVSAEPPMLLICLNRSSRTQGAVVAAGSFVLNVLDESQAALATRFASGSTEKFAGLRLSRGNHDAPVIRDALAQLHCRVVHIVDVATHLIVLADIETASAREGKPLIHYRGRMCRLTG